MKMPLFPLETVVFPGQELNLHVFERKYRQLIHECWQNEERFGIPPLLGNRISVHASEVEVAQIKNMSEDGSMDVLVKGTGVIKVNQYFEHMPERLFPGGEVERADNSSLLSADVTDELLSQFTQLNRLLNRKIDDDEILTSNFSFRIGHKIGFSLKQKIKLLSMANERDRQKLILQYLDEVVPILQTVVKQNEGPKVA